MDILIKNMEMPKEGSITITIRHDGVINFIGDMGSNLGRLVDCKAIELPPHGRLGDLDKLLIRANCIDVFGNPDNTIDRIIQAIEKAPTIVEANYGSDN